MTDPTPSFDDVSVAAILAQRSRADRQALLEDLVALLAEAVPGVQVEREWLRKRVKSVRLPLGGYVYALTRTGDAFEARRLQEVRGVVVRTFPLEIEAFLAELGLALDEELRRTDRGRDALRRWLQSPNT